MEEMGSLVTPAIPSFRYVAADDEIKLNNLYYGKCKSSYLYLAAGPGGGNSKGFDQPGDFGGA